MPLNHSGLYERLGYHISALRKLSEWWLHPNRWQRYRPRSVDALRPYLAQIEAHILQQAGVSFDGALEPGKLRVVAS